MRFLGFQITRATHTQRSAPETPVSQLSPAASAWLRGEDLDAPGPVLSNAYQQLPWVYRAVNALAEQVANIPFLFSRGGRGRENLITSGPLLDFYAQPHPHINAFQYWELRIIWLMLRGECMRVPIYESGPPSSSSSYSYSSSPPSPAAPSLHHSTTPSLRSRRLRSVLILDPSHFQHIIQNGHLVGWRYTGFGPRAPLPSQVFLPEEVWFEKLPNPFDFWRGMSPLFPATVAAQTDFAAASFMKGLMENNADLGVIVRTDQQLDDAQQEQLLANLRDRKRRAGTADKPLLLWSGAEVIKPTLSSANLQFLENRKFTRSEICAAFGVPEEIVTTTEHNEYDVMSGARLNFIENRVAPLCRRLESEENATTIPAIMANAGASPSEIQNQNSKIENSLGSLSASQIENRKSKIENSVVGWFDIDSLPIMQEALRKRLLAAKTGFDMGIPFNELNRMFDLGSKPLPWGDTGYLPTKYQPLK